MKQDAKLFIVVKNPSIIGSLVTSVIRIAVIAMVTMVAVRAVEDTIDGKIKAYDDKKVQDDILKSS